MEHTIWKAGKRNLKKCKKVGKVENLLWKDHKGVNTNRMNVYLEYRNLAPNNEAYFCILNISWEN